MEMHVIKTYAIPFLHELASDKKRLLTEQEAESIAAANSALHQADAVVICLGGKAGRLGESVVGTGLLESMLLALKHTGKVGTPVNIIVDEGIAELFAERPYQEKYWPHIRVRHVTNLQDSTAMMGEQVQGRHVLVVDFHGAHDDMPSLQSEQAVRPDGRTITTLAHLFRVGVRSYAQRGPERRYADFVEDLFGVPQGVIDGRQAQPTILLSSADETRYPLLASEFGLDGEAMQIICFFQSVVPAKCYCRWDEVLMMLCEHFAQHFPGKKLDFLLACGPEASVPDGIRKADLEADFQGFTGVNNNARILVRATPSLRDLAIVTRHAVLALSNDTGPGHIAGALHVPTITPYLPGNVYSKNIWSSTLWHHGVTLEPNPFSFRQIEAAILWDKTDIIDSIPPENLLQEALRYLPGEA